MANRLISLTDEQDELRRVKFRVDLASVKVVRLKIFTLRMELLKGYEERKVFP